MALNKAILICHFYDSLKLSIRAQSDKQGWELDTSNTAIKKTIDAKAKTACQLLFWVREIDT